MIDQQDIDLLNDKFYSLEIPNEPIKMIMFYFTVLNKLIDFQFPRNYLNYEHPYFQSYSEMDEFFTLARILNPEMLHQHNVFIYYNEKNYYKYYQINDKDENNDYGVQYEFKIVDNEESFNPLFEDNYKNNFNISNINKNETEFEVEIPKKVDFIHLENDSDDSIEEHYIRDEEENDENKYNLIKVKINNKLVVTNDWIDFIYNKPAKNLLYSAKSVDKNDAIRKKSISLPRNIFFHLTILSLVLLGTCSLVLFSICASLKNNDRFAAYRGKILNETFNKEDENSIVFNYLLLLDENNNINDTEIDYNNDTIIVPEISKSKKILKGCQFGETSGIFAWFFIVFIIYMTIRIARERRKRYQKSEKRRKVGLNLCHIVLFILLTLLAFILTLVAEIYIGISIAQNTYNFIHSSVRSQLVLNSIVFVAYILIIIFYFKI